MARHYLFPVPGRVLDAYPGLARPLTRVEGMLVRLAWGLAALLSPDRASAVGRWLARRIAKLHPKFEKIRGNLRVAFPEKRADEIDRLARDALGEMGALLAEFPHFPTICGAEAEERVEIAVKGEIEALRDPDRPVVFVTAHIGNWQLATAVAARLGKPVTAIYKPERNPRIARAIARYRAALRCRLVARENSLRQLIRELSAGRSLGLVIDNRHDGGEMVPFFGVPTPSNVIPARLALRFGCELVPARAERLEGARFRITIYEPVRPDDATADPREQALDMTRKLNEHFERWIRERPEQWMCTKRRWPKDVYPSHAGAGGV